MSRQHMILILTTQREAWGKYHFSLELELKFIFKGPLYSDPEYKLLFSRSSIKIVTFSWTVSRSLEHAVCRLR